MSFQYRMPLKGIMMNETEFTLETSSIITDFLLSRHSSHHLSAPAPSASQLEIILKAGMKAPDFQYLRPYRFLIASEEGLTRLGQKMANAAKAENKPENIIHRVETMPHRAPMVITIVATPKTNKHVSQLDQLLCASSTVLMMQLAALSLGLNGIWRSGWLMQSRAFHQELNLNDDDQIVGFLYLGTPTPHVLSEHTISDPYAYSEWL